MSAFGSKTATITKWQTLPVLISLWTDANTSGTQPKAHTWAAKDHAEHTARHWMVGNGYQRGFQQTPAMCNAPTKDSMIQNLRLPDHIHIFPRRTPKLMHPPPINSDSSKDAPAGCMKRLIRWLFRCRHKWEENQWKGMECVEERCIKCNGHRYKVERTSPPDHKSGWQPGRYKPLPKTK